MTDFDALDLACNSAIPAPVKRNALKSLYGAGNQVRAMVGEGEREQEVLTPQSVVDGLRTLWPQGVGLDPCHAPGSLVGAAVQYRVEGVLVDRPGKDPVRIYTPQEGELSGLVEPWLDRTYVNPPFKFLKDWLEKALSEPGPWVLLGPIRLQRVWFRHAWRSVDAKVALNPLAFYGEKQGFPQALALLYRGPDREGFVRAFAHLGEAI